MRRGKKFKILIVCLFVLFIFNGCGISNVPNEEQVLKDFVNYYGNGSVSYKRAEIDKRQTNKDDKEDIIYCTIFGEGEYANQNIECIMRYTYYDKGGWQFENIEITNSTIESGSLRGPDADIYATEIINDPLSYLDEDLRDDNEPDVINAEYEDDFLYEENLEWELVISFDMQKTTSLGYTVSGRINIDYYYDISSDMWYEYDSNYAIDSQEITGLEGTWIPERYPGGIYILTKNEDGTYKGTSIWISEEGYEGGYSFIEIKNGIYQGDEGKYTGEDKIIENIDVIKRTFHLRDARGMSYVTGSFGWDDGVFGISEAGRWNSHKKVESN